MKLIKINKYSLNNINLLKAISKELSILLSYLHIKEKMDSKILNSISILIWDKN